MQGLNDESKVALLKKLVNKEISVKEFQESAKSIKRKHKVVSAFMTYAGADSWKELQHRFPKFATEDKMSQFRDLVFQRGKRLPVVSITHALSCLYDGIHVLVFVSVCSVMLIVCASEDVSCNTFLCVGMMKMKTLKSLSRCS